MASQDFDPDLYTKSSLLTKTYHRDVYPAISPKNPKNSAAGKVVLITGASRGLGRAMASSWALAGASAITVCSRRAADLEGVIGDIGKANPETKTLALACDVTKDEAVKGLMEKVKEKFGQLDVVVANAGFANQGPKAWPKIGEMEQELWWDDQQVNIRSVHLTAHHFIRTFGPDINGTFIDMTSSAGLMTLPGLSSYGIAKLVCLRLVEYLDVEYPNLKAFSLNPGIVRGIASMEAFQPYAHDTPELVGAFAVWLGSGRADGIKGGYVNVNWDVEELEKHAEEIQEKRLLKSRFFEGVLGPEGYSFEK